MSKIKLLISPPVPALPKAFLISINSKSINLMARVKIIYGILLWFLNSISPNYTQSEIQISVCSLYAFYVLAPGYLTFSPLFTQLQPPAVLPLFQIRTQLELFLLLEGSFSRFHLVHSLNSFMSLLKHHFPRPISNPCLFLLFYFCHGAYHYLTTYHNILNVLSSPIWCFIRTNLCFGL